MATQKGSKHSVGNLNSRDVRTIPEVMAGANIENYTLVSLAHVDGVRKASPLADNTADGYLACAVEILYDNEKKEEFYVGEGEYFRIIHLPKGIRFETSAFTGTPAIGQVASFDPTNAVFTLGVDPALDTAKNHFEVVDILDGEYGFGLPMVRLEVIK